MISRLARVLSVPMAMVLLVVLAAACVGTPAEVPALPRQERLRVATTTSLYDTGLWSYLEPVFEAKYGLEMDIIYAGTGIALEYGRRGDVDVITVHDREREEKFIADGHGLERVPFAYNHFLIVGPADDPAQVKGLSPEDAFRKLMARGTEAPEMVRFLSRGDESGTHGKEKVIWQTAGFDYEVVRASDWAKYKNEGYQEVGRGMGPALLMASEKQAYTLTDMGTYLAYQGELQLVPLVESGRVLLNVYSVIAINPEKHPKTRAEMAARLIDFLTSPQTQELIGNYGVREYGRQLFMPCAGVEPGW